MNEESVKRRHLRFRDDGSVRVWTLQPRALWEKLQKERTLYVDPSLIDPDFIPEYDWMRQKMSERLPGYRGGYPWWGWAHPKPDLRRWFSGTHSAGTPCVRMDLSIPRDRVLLSNEAAWICILNRRYLWRSEEDHRAWEIESAGLERGDLRWPHPEPWHSRVLESWNRVFDIEGLIKGEEWSDARQATFEELSLRNVVRIEEYDARRR